MLPLLIKAFLNAAMLSADNQIEKGKTIPMIFTILLIK